VIGHEVSHTFDTEGAAFDSKGRVRNWWTPADLAHFEASNAELAEQYEHVQTVSGSGGEWQADVGGNLADVAGIAASYDAYHAALAGKTPPEQAGFNGDQQFFLAYGQTRANKPREARCGSRC